MATQNYSIRPASSADRQFLREMLYQSLYVPEGGAPFPREVLDRPEIAKYVEGWGRAGDIGFVALELGSNEPVGAAWLRLLVGVEKGYGHVRDETPELAMAVLPAHRGRGVGSALLARLLETARAEYDSVSLSVSSDNPAVRLYVRMGFERVSVSDTSITMIKSLRS